jgi:hypothetical protein
MEDENKGSDKQEGHPDAKKVSYKIVIDKGHHETTNPTPTGRDILNLAGRAPVEQFGLYLKEKGQQPKRIGLDEIVDLREPGTERFVTLPLDQTEG